MSECIVYPMPGYALAYKAKYELEVRAKDSTEWQQVPIYAVTVDMHDPREAGMAQFDFTGEVEVKITYNKFSPIYQASIHPKSLGIEPEVEGSELRFTLTKPANLAIVVNNDRFHNLHLFTRAVEPAPDKTAPNVLVIKERMQGVDIMLESGPVNDKIRALGDHPIVYFEKGYHSMGEFLWKVPSNTTVYFEGGAVFRGGLILEDVENVRIYGRGIIDQKAFGQISGAYGVRIQRSKNIEIQDLTFLDPGHYTVYIGNSSQVQIQNVCAFSCEGWTDGIDMMSSEDVTVSGGFLRTSDDCIAVYGSRWQNYGDSRNILVENITLWADVAHPMMIGTHGDHQRNGDIIENVTFRNIDVLDQHEMQPEYLGVMAIVPGDKNLVRNIRYEDIRVEHITHGRLFEFCVKYNPDYNPAPGRGIEDVTARNIFVTSCEGEEVSRVAGYDSERMVKRITFENIVRDGRRAESFADAKIDAGSFAEEIAIR